jgi:hypothetical protein
VRGAGAPPTSATPGPRPTTPSVYDGAATPQTELEAPAPGTDSLGLDAPSGDGWRNLFGHGFVYASLRRDPDGLAFGALGF